MILGPLRRKHGGINDSQQSAVARFRAILIGSATPGCER